MSNVGTGTFCVNVTDAAGCSNVFCYSVTNLDCCPEIPSAYAGGQVSEEILIAAQMIVPSALNCSDGGLDIDIENALPAVALAKAGRMENKQSPVYN